MELLFRRTRRIWLVLALAAFVALPVSVAGAASDADAIETAADIGGGVMLDETPVAWFVQLSDSPASFRANAKAAGLNVKQRFEYSSLWKGVSVVADKKDVSVITRLPGVEGIFPVVTIDAPEVGTISPELATAIEMTGASTAHALGYTGAGVKVAVMDTGVDYDHADLGGDGTQRTDSTAFPTSRVIAGWDFVGDEFNADPASAAYNPAAVADPRPDDCNGHGTHVAGIVGANGEVVGVAPGVQFGAYRVFGCEGSTTADIMLAAMERAEADGMDILNMSIGSAFQTWPQYPTAVGADALVDRGMIVVTSIGNSGANGVYSAGAPGVGNNVIGVGSIDNTHVSALTFRTNPAGTQIPYLTIGDAAAPPTSGSTPEVVYVGRGCTKSGPTWDLPAEDPYLANPSGKVALIDRGVCTFDAKYQRAVDAGAVGVVIANNSTGLFTGGGIVDRGVFAIGISLADGTALKAEIAAGPVTLTWTTTRVNAVNPTGGTMSSFSSYGLTAELKLKPNVSAPGGLIRSTYPLEKGAHAIVSGTSMASPHVAGAAALLLQARPGTTAAEAKTLFQNSADPVSLAAPNTAFLQAVHRQGAGMVDIDDAITSSARVTPSEVSLGEGSGGTFTLTVVNHGSVAVTYTLGHQQAVSTGGATNAPGLFLGHATAAFTAPSVTVAAGGSASVGVTISAAVVQGRQYGGYVRLTGDDGTVLRVPYAGFSGDYQAIQVLTSARCSLPGLFKLGGATTCDEGASDIAGVTRVTEDGVVYTMMNGDVPYFLLHFEHQARRLEMTVLDESGAPFTGKGANQRNPTFYVQDYLPRNSTATAFFLFAWDGTLQRQVPGRVGEVTNKVPSGVYQVQVRVLKALGDASNPDHWETWTSPKFQVKGS